MTIRPTQGSRFNRPIYHILAQDCMLWARHEKIPLNYTYDIPHHCVGRGENTHLMTILKADYRTIDVDVKRTGLFRNECYLNGTLIDTATLGYRPNSTCICSKSSAGNNVNNNTKLHEIAVPENNNTETIFTPEVIQPGCSKSSASQGKAEDKQKLLQLKLNVTQF